MQLRTPLNPLLPPRLPRLDALRGVAILGVILFHIFGALYLFEVPSFDPATGRPDLVAHYGGRLPALLSPLRVGVEGVMLFFVVSGFCIHLGTLQWWRSQGERGRWGVFFAEFTVRRMLRLYPAYLVALLIFSFWFCTERVDLSDSADRFHFVSHLFLFHNLLPETRLTINGSFWSIGTEVQLYAVYPLLLLFIWNRLWIPLVAAGLFLFTWFYLKVMPGRALFIVTQVPFSFWIFWGLGALLARGWVENRPILGWYAPLWLLGLLGGLFVGGFYWQPLLHWEWIVRPLFFVLATERFLQRDRAGVPLNRLERLLVFVGIPSYSLYLIHQPPLGFVIDWLKRWAWQESPYLVTAAAFLLVPLFLLALALPFYRWIEVPSHQFARAAGGRLRGWLATRCAALPRPARVAARETNPGDPT